MRVRIAGWLIAGLGVLVAMPAAGQGVVVPAEDLGAVRDTLDLLQSQPFRLQPFLLPGSEKIYLDGTRLDSTQYRLDARHGRLWIDGLLPDPRRELVVVYRTWGVAFAEAYRRRTLAPPTESDSAGAVAVVEQGGGRQTGAFDPFGGVQLERSGSISRGILVGNNRDATVESGLRMQVAGEVADGVRVQAVLTDENTPILPEGTTQRLNEFDRVFIEIEAPQGTAQLGDFDLRFARSEFARMNRKLQGITVFGALPDPDTGIFGGGRVAAAGATARGLFRTQDVAVIDGVQGPYRLEGQNGEQFIIVIPGSEVVYLNGVRLTRGETHDYVIDYATGEVTFSSTRLITADDRVTVEFQYRTTEFTRTLVATEADVGLWQRADGVSRLNLGVTFLREADSRQFNEEFGLTEEDQELLEMIGDSTATQDGATPVIYDPEAPFVQYVRRDTVLADGTPTTYFQALTAAPPDSVAVFRVRFTRVGFGQGAYARQGRAVNGILYVYRGPGGGDYAPIRLLPKPRQQRLLDLRGGIEPIPFVEIFGEWAQSLNDENRFSDVGSEDDLGSAYIGGVRLKPLPISIDETDLGTLSARLRRRFTGDDFASFDRTRPVEFARQWNLDARTTGRSGSIVQQGDETIDEAQLRWDASPQSHLEAELGRLRLPGRFEGTRRTLAMQAAEAGWPRLGYRLEHITSDDAVRDEDGLWVRQLGRLDQPLFGGRFVPNFEIEQERRRQRVLGTDSLAAGSFAFVEIRPGLAWRSEKLTLSGSLERRLEDQWLDGALRDAGRAWTLQSAFEFRPGRALTTEGSIGWRTREVDETFVARGEQGRRSVAIRWNGRFQPGARVASVNWFYEALTERAPVLQEIYVRTGPEIGQFVWEDFNGDGAIQIDEFIPERTQDEGTYVRTFIPSDSLQSVISVQARVGLQLEPRRAWRDAAGLKKLLAHVSTRTTIQVQEKSREDQLSRIYLLNQRFFRDPERTLKGLLRFAQDVTLFRDQSRYGVDLSYNAIRSLNVLEAGQETRTVDQWRAEGTYRPSTRWGVRLLTALEDNRTDSENFASRRFDIRGISAEPEVSFSPIQAIQLSAGAAFARKKDSEKDRTAEVFKLPVTARFSLARRLTLSGRFEVADVTLDGDATGLASFELTDGRGPGTSYLWNVSGWYQINRLLRATLSYNGRAPADAPTLHTVRLQLSAVF